MKLTKKKIIILSVLAVVIALCIWDISAPPLWWQFDAQSNRKAILKYARAHYPDARIVEEYYPSAKLSYTGNPHDSITFELDGIEFLILARDGEFTADSYSRARAQAQFDKIIQDGYLNPRGLSARVGYSFLEPCGDSYPFTGSLGVEMKIESGALSPREVGWLYDFYKYWNSSVDYLNYYHLYIGITENNVEKFYIAFYSSEESFDNEDDFYSAFKSKPDLQ